MHIPKKYFHDRTVLLLLCANLFILVISCVLVALRLSSDTKSVYIVQYRPSLGKADEYLSGTATDIVAFLVFSMIVFISHAALSVRAYSMRRHLASTILALGTLLLLLSLIISNSLLVL